MGCVCVCGKAVGCSANFRLVPVTALTGVGWGGDERGWGLRPDPRPPAPLHAITPTLCPRFRSGLLGCALDNLLARAAHGVRGHRAGRPGVRELEPLAPRHHSRLNDIVTPRATRLAAPQPPMGRREARRLAPRLARLVRAAGPPGPPIPGFSSRGPSPRRGYLLRAGRRELESQALMVAPIPSLFPRQVLGMTHLYRMLRRCTCTDACILASSTRAMLTNRAKLTCNRMCISHVSAIIKKNILERVEMRESIRSVYISILFNYYFLILKKKKKATFLKDGSFVLDWK